VDWWHNEDALPEWRATDEEPRSQWLAITLVFGLPVVALLIGGAATSAWGAALIGVFVVGAVVIGVIDSWQGQRAAVSITMDSPDDFVVRQANGRDERYPFAAVSGVRVTRDDGDDTLSLRITVRDKVVRTRSGPAAAATTFLALCTEAGATVTHRTVSTD
jgi:hypothetical protein